MVDVILSCNNSAEVYKLPVPPAELPEVSMAVSNEKLATNNKALTVLGNSDSRSFALEFMIPEYEGKYRWQRSWHYDNAMDYYDWLVSIVNRRIPMRIVVFNCFEELMNIAVAISNISFRIDRQLDIHIKCDFVEFNFVG